MQKLYGKVHYSASDLVNYLECEHLTSLELFNLSTPLPKTEDSEEVKLIQAKGYAHEARYVEFLKSQYSSFINIAASGGTHEEKVSATERAMQDGVDVIYQATLQDGDFIGNADFLRKVSRPSNLGKFSYEVLDTKLSRATKAKFIIQLGFYSALVAKVQGIEPFSMHVILGDMTEDSYRSADYSRYLNLVRERFLAMVKGEATETDSESTHVERLLLGTHATMPGISDKTGHLN